MEFTFSFTILATACLSTPSFKVNITMVEVPSADTIFPLYMSFDMTLIFRLSSFDFVCGRSYWSTRLLTSIPPSSFLMSMILVRLVTVEIPSVCCRVSVTCFMFSRTDVLKILSVFRMIIPMEFPPN